MEALGVQVKLSEPYDAKKGLLSALKAAGYAAGGVIVAEQMGLSGALFTFLSTHGLPTQFYVVAQLVVAGLFAWLKNYLSNKGR